MPIEDLEAKIKAVMAKSKTALAAQPAPAPVLGRLLRVLPPPPVAAAPAPPEPEPAALLDAVFGGDGDVAAPVAGTVEEPPRGPARRGLPKRRRSVLEPRSCRRPRRRASSR